MQVHHKITIGKENSFGQRRVRKDGKRWGVAGKIGERWFVAFRGGSGYFQTLADIKRAAAVSN